MKKKINKKRKIEKEKILNSKNEKVLEFHYTLHWCISRRKEILMFFFQFQKLLELDSLLKIVEQFICE